MLDVTSAVVGKEPYGPLNCSRVAAKSRHRFGRVRLILNHETLYICVGPITTNSVEIYNPVTESFITTSSMITSRQQHTATLLDDGTVLVAGGYDGNDETSKAELFNPID